ncbi:hypothetical protein DYBT9275_02489 [Dyadobacter sp. CECT 9275]|uniref:C1q domain-containing protein n=1 Tax=Dyadobacter helix TaxID=2822344 RepID=A0A916JFR4_9BACT|nr:complement C1q domain-containing protein [Dyadobacter sp. CECT 9275]CAG5000570.1 hypothetical protein DYBT9275_02489 [Dyadobacter sp. CECT 9275]
MKKLSKSLFASVLTAALCSSLTLCAQVKIGTNPETIEATSNLEVEASTAGRKVKVDNTSGQLTISDGTQGTGKVLTSDATGGASWQDKDVLCNSFEASRTSQTIATGASTTLIPTTENFDPSNAYNVATGVYTVPEDGVYVFTGSANDGGSATGVRNSIISILSDVKGNLTLANSADLAYTKGIWLSVSAITKAVAGEKITLKYSVAHVSGTNPTNINIGAIRFAGSRMDCNTN